MCIGYAKAISDELALLSAATNNIPAEVAISCTPPSYSDEALLVSARKYLLDHLGELSKPGPILMQSALIDPLTCHPGKAQDKNIDVYATGRILVGACLSKDEYQLAQCLGYLDGIYDYETGILDDTEKHIPATATLCKRPIQQSKQLWPAISASIVAHPEYLEAPAANVVGAVLTPPPPCPFARH
jgi:hypothetical protein